MLYIAFVCIFCRFFCSHTIKIIFPKKKHIFRHTILKLLNTSIPLLIHLFNSIYSFIVNQPYASSCCLQVNTYVY